MNMNESRPHRLSLVGRGIAVLGAVTMLAWPVAAWLNPELLATLLPVGVAATGDTLWALLVVSLLPAAMFFGAMVEAFRLFALLGRGQAFTGAMPRSLERLGYWSIGCAVAGVVTPTLMGLVATWGAADGTKQLIIRFGSGEIAGLVVALLLLAFGRVMREALQLARENREFV